MKPEPVVHVTTVVEHRFTVSPAVVFDAWADVDKRAKWNLPGGDDWTLVELKQDFRIGGRESARFGPKGAATFWSAGEFLDIVDDARIVSAGTMHDGNRRTSTTMCTIEFFADGIGTRLVLTDQSAFLDGESPIDRKSGWGKSCRASARSWSTAGDGVKRLVAYEATVRAQQEKMMAKFITIGYGDEKGYEQTKSSLLDAAHAHDNRLKTDGALIGIAGRPVQVRNHDGSGTRTTTGAFMRSDLPIAGFAVIDATSLEEAIAMVSESPCAVAHGVVEVWPLDQMP